MPIFGKTVCYLEKINSKFIACTTDNGNGNAETDVVYLTKKSTHKRIDLLFFFQTLHIWLKHLEIVFLIQAYGDAHDISGIVGFSFYGHIFHVCTMKIQNVI